MNLRVRSNPSASATIVTIVSAGATGTIVCQGTCPLNADGYKWWRIQWDNPVSTGWSVDGAEGAGFIQVVSAPPQDTPGPTQDAQYGQTSPYVNTTTSTSVTPVTTSVTPSTTSTATSVHAGLSITSLSSTSGPVGKVITINGSGFVTTTTASPYTNTIFFNGAIAQSMSSPNGTTLTFTVGTFQSTCTVSPCVGSSAVSLAPGTYKVRVSNKNGNSNEVNFTVTETAAPSAPLAISTASVPDGIVGQAYSVDVIAAGGSGDYTWSPVTQAPLGLSFNNPKLLCNGISLCQKPLTLSGTPMYPGTYTFSVQVSAGGVTTSRSYTMKVTAVSTGPLGIVTTSLPNAVLGEPYGATISATGGEGFYQWLSTGSFPSGVGAQTDYSTPNRTMRIAGTPVVEGSFPFSARVTSGSASASRNFILNVVKPSGPTIASLAPVSGPKGATITISGSGFVINTTASPYVNTIWFGGSLLSNVGSPNGTTLTFIVPSMRGQYCVVSPCVGGTSQPITAGTYKIRVDNKNGNSNEVDFVVQ